MLFHLKKGLDIPIDGAPQQIVETAGTVQSVALTGLDYLDLKPRMRVKQGQRVKLGELLFTDKSTGVSHTSPGSGVVSHIHYGPRHRLETIVIQLDGEEEEVFSCYQREELAGLDTEVVRHQLQISGLWSAFRGRPFSKPPEINSQAHALFVSAIDSDALAADPAIVIAQFEQDFIDGLTVISRLADVPVYVCKAAGSVIPQAKQNNIKVVEFSGPHPAGLVGTHIHYLHPVDKNTCVWHLNYQDLIAIGKLFTSGRLWVERIVSLAGPQVKRPRLVRSRIGANINELLEGEIKKGENRVVSGSLLSGRHVRHQHVWLGRYHLQVSVIEEYNNLARAQGKVFSINQFLPAFARRESSYSFTTATHGAQRHLLPIGNFEQVLPLDILPSLLFKALMVEDLATAQSLGCLELDEEDLSLCSFVCCSKIDYAAALRLCLSRIESDS